MYQPNPVMNRKSIRLKEYDYSQPGYYFLTICIQNRSYLFGNIEHNEMILNPAGCMLQKWWNELRHKFSNVTLDTFVIMPNHIHGIIVITEAQIDFDRRGGPMCPPIQNQAPLPEIIQWFKTMSTNEYIKNVKEHNWKAFDKRIWQRNYYEHIIRNEKALNIIRNYIVMNPMQWEADRENFDITMKSLDIKHVPSQGQTHRFTPTDL